MIQKRFKYFGNIIFYIFYEVFNFLLYLYIKTTNLSTKNNTLHPWIAENNKYFSYFQNYLGILDNIHTLTYVLASNIVVYQNWKTVLLKNVLKVYTKNI